MNAKKNKGLNLLELLLVLGIVSTVLAVAFFMFGKNRDEVNAREVARNVSVAVTSARSIFATADGATTEGLNAGVLEDMKVVPSSDVLTSKWGSMNIAGADIVTGNICTSSTPTCTGIAVYFDSVPSESCLPFIQNVEGQAISVKIDNQFVKSPSQQSGVDVATMTRLCNANAVVRIDLAFD